MQAHELATPYPTVTLETPADEAARVLTEHRRPGLIVVDRRGQPLAVLGASQFLKLLVPGYVQDDPALARVLDEKFADQFCARLAEKSVKDLMPKEPAPLPVVNPDDTVLEVAAIMAARRSPLVAVVARDDDGPRLLGAISVAALLEHVLPPQVS
ncbi:CBS domain-containing protein [Nocardioides taihuensis]|uniref:CBS domain-containing protein n=1 Tax=Nocardioides taihuensis TaxID=1835606 RepID=A0ABW0BHK8_9ACTN